MLKGDRSCSKKKPIPILKKEKEERKERERKIKKKNNRDFWKGDRKKWKKWKRRKIQNLRDHLIISKSYFNTKISVLLNLFIAVLPLVFVPCLAEKCVLLTGKTVRIWAAVKKLVFLRETTRKREKKEKNLSDHTWGFFFALCILHGP